MILAIKTIVLVSIVQIVIGWDQQLTTLSALGRVAQRACLFRNWLKMVFILWLLGLENSFLD